MTEASRLTKIHRALSPLSTVGSKLQRESTSSVGPDTLSPRVFIATLGFQNVMICISIVVRSRFSGESLTNRGQGQYVGGLGKAPCKAERLLAISPCLIFSRIAGSMPPAWQVQWINRKQGLGQKLYMPLCWMPSEPGPTSSQCPEGSLENPAGARGLDKELKAIMCVFSWLRLGLRRGACFRDSEPLLVPDYIKSPASIHTVYSSRGMPKVLHQPLQMRQARF